MGNDNHVVSHKLCGFQRRVGRRIFVMKEQCGACSDFLLRSPGKFHNQSQRCLRAQGLGCEMSRLPHFLDNRLTDGGDDDNKNNKNGINSNIIHFSSLFTC
jgi:hypothetical protein